MGKKIINTIIVVFLIFFNIIVNTNSKLKCATKVEGKYSNREGSGRNLEKFAQVRGIKHDNNHDNQTISKTETYNHIIRKRDLLDDVNVFELAALPDILHTSSGGEQSIKLTLYTLKNKDEEQLIGPDTLLSKTNWNNKEDAIFYIHGWMQAGQDDLLQKAATVLKTSLLIKNAFMETNRTENIILVDWQMNSRQVDYFSAAKDVRRVGQTLGDMIISLKNRKFLTFDQVTLVGFSLGSHVSGIAGLRVRHKTKETIARITGLDPAGPGFESTVNVNYRLDKSDAKFVQIIHCNAGELIPYRHLGTTVISGHVDFFPNGGTTQPTCETLDLALSACSHLKCTQLYASTVRGTIYKGCECENVENFNNGACEDCSGPPMGYICPTNATGTYYLKATILEKDSVQVTDLLD